MDPGPRRKAAQDRERLLQAIPSGLKFQLRSQHLESFLFLIYVSRGKSEEKPMEHLLHLHLEGRKYAPSLLGKHCKHWCFHSSNTSWFSKSPAWWPVELVQGKNGVQPPGMGRFALGAELGICEFSSPSTPKWHSCSLVSTGL